MRSRQSDRCSSREEYERGETSRMTRHKRPLRIALLTPYSGANLGDGAIHDAIIKNLLDYRNDIEFVSIVGEPRTTSAIHGYPAITMTGKHGRWISPRSIVKGSASDKPNSSHPRGAGGQDGSTVVTSRPPWLNRAWLAAKDLPAFGSILTSLLRVTRTIWNCRYEPEHVVRSLLHARRFDLILVCGGGQLDDSWGGAWAHPYVLFRWAAIAELTGTPYAIASVGVGSISSRLSRFFIRTACAWADYRSFRDIGSRERLSNWTFTQQDAIVPDFAYSVPVKTNSVLANPKPIARIAVSPIRFGAHRRSASDPDRIYRDYLSTLARFAFTVTDSAQEVVFFTSSSDDHVALKHLFAEMRRLRPALDPATLVTLPSEGSSALIAALSDVDVVVASRLHSVVLGQRVGCATLAISFDQKVNAHMSLFDQQESVLDVSNLTLNTLIDRYQDLLDNIAPVRSSVFQRAEFLAAQVHKQYPILIKMAEEST